MIELIVSDMMCGDCADTVTRAIGSVDRCGEVQVDVHGRWVRIDSGRPAGHFVSAIGEAGFTPVVWWDGSPAPRGRTA